MEPIKNLRILCLFDHRSDIRDIATHYKRHFFAGRSLWCKCFHVDFVVVDTFSVCFFLTQ